MICKILRAHEAAALARDGVFAGSPDDARDGFVHLSTAAQAPGTAAKHFAGESGLVLAAVAAARLGEALRWEVSRGGARFPHLYRELRASDVLWTRPLPLGPDGAHVFPEGFR